MQRSAGNLQGKTLRDCLIRNGEAREDFLQLCLTLHDPTDYSPPGSSVHGIFQARVLEWGAIAFSVQKPYFNKKGSLHLPQRVSRP